MAADKVAPVSRGQVAWLLEGVVDQSGERLRKAGQERWTATLDVADAKGTVVLSAVKVTMEWPGKLALEAEGNRTIFAQGSATAVGVRSEVAELAEMLLEDTLDGFLALHRSWASTRIMGTGYPDPYTKGASCNVISLIMRGATKDPMDFRTKGYWFDIKSRRLVLITHSTPGIEVRLGEWVQVQGNEFASKMTMYERGAVKYTVKLTPAGAGPALGDGLFGSL